MSSTSEYENEWGETIVHWSKQDNPFFTHMPVVHIARAVRRLGDDEVTTPDTQCTRVFTRVRGHRVDMNIMNGPEILARKGSIAMEHSFYDMLPFDALASDPPPKYTTWNPLDCSARLVLENNNLTAVQNGALYSGVRSVASNTTGKWYVEIDVSNPNMMPGLMTKLAAIENNYPGQDQYGLGLWYTGIFHNNAAVEYWSQRESPYKSTIVGLLIDLDTRKLKYVVEQGAGLLYSPVVNIPAGAIHIATGNGTAEQPAQRATLNAGQKPFSMPLPDGYNAGFWQL